MKKIITKTISDNFLIQNLKLQTNEQSDYILVENGLEPLDNEINVFFDPNNLNDVKAKLMRIGYYNFYDDLIVCQKEDEIHLLNIKDVIYIEGIKADVYIHTKSDEYITKDSLKNLEIVLSDKKFIRISKGYIISLYQVKKIKTTFGNNLLVLLTNNQELEVSRHYSKNLKRILGL